MRKLKIFAACLTVLIAGHTSAIHAKTNGENATVVDQTISDLERKANADDKGYVFENLHSLSDFPAEKPPETSIVRAKDIDWKSHPEAWSFRTRLREGLKEGPDFAGKYSVVGNGCGTSCQEYWIINLETGKVIKSLETKNGVTFSVDSRLFITNINDGDYELSMDDIYLQYIESVDYYVIQNDKMEKIDSVAIPRDELLKRYTPKY